MPDPTADLLIVHLSDDKSGLEKARIFSRKPGIGNPPAYWHAACITGFRKK
jgi:hypothetical protein